VHIFTKPYVGYLEAYYCMIIQLLSNVDLPFLNDVFICFLRPRRLSLCYTCVNGRKMNALKQRSCWSLKRNNSRIMSCRWRKFRFCILSPTESISKARECSVWYKILSCPLQTTCRPPQQRDDIPHQIWYAHFRWPYDYVDQWVGLPAWMFLLLFLPRDAMHPRY